MTRHDIDFEILEALKRSMTSREDEERLARDLAAQKKRWKELLKCQQSQGS